MTYRRPKAARSMVGDDPNGSGGTTMRNQPAPTVEYYVGGFWNELPTVQREIEHRITGVNPAAAVPVLETVIRHFSRAVGGRRFKRALFINCGNGRVERRYHELGVIESGVGCDISADLIAQAQRDAGDAGLEYYHRDVNEADFPPGPYDLIVNHNAGHHVAYLDRAFRALRRILAPADTPFRTTTWGRTAINTTRSHGIRPSD